MRQFSCYIELVHPRGFEPLASASARQRSIQLSYGCSQATHGYTTCPRVNYEKVPSSRGSDEQI